MSDKINLRDYQQDIVNQTINSNKHTLIQVPTGGGKTVISRFIAFDLAYKQDKQVLFVAPKLVLMEQTLKAFKDINPQKVHGIEYYNPKHKVLVSTLQTASRREELQPDVIIIDEIHHGYDGSMIERLIKDKPHTRVIGLSATPYDRKGKLLKGFKLILDKYDMNYMIEHNFLVGLKSYVLVRQDLSEVKITAGDYNLGELSQVVCNKNTILEIIETTKKFILESKKTIVFAVDITHAELLTKAYVEKGFNAKALHSKIKKDEVKKEIELFREGKTQVLVSVLMLTTGFDVPDTDCAVIARPTKSQNLYKQMVGRVLRIAPDKTSAILLDCGNVIDNLGMPLDPIHEISRNDTKHNNKQKCRSCGTEDIKLIKKDNKLYWECQNKKCLFLKEVKQGTYECENCHLIHSHTSNYIFENDKIILNCECGFKTVVSEYKKQEVFFEVDKTLVENPWINDIVQWSKDKNLSIELLTSKKILNLKELSLFHNNLDDLPVEIGELRKLKTLSLHGNNLIRLPNEIINLKNLKNLRLSGNIKLVLSEKQKEWLKELKKKNCKISIDDNIDIRTKDEKWIKILESWGKDFGINFFIVQSKTMVDLKELHMLNRKIDYIPSEIGNLINLKKIYASNNNLEEIPSKIGNLYNLTHFWLSENNLIKLPEEIVNLKNLKELWLHENSNLMLSEEQEAWLRELKNNKCKIYIDVDYSEKKEIEMLEVGKEEKFTIEKEEPLLNKFLKWFR